jgi:hypothetical protein
MQHGFRTLRHVAMVFAFWLALAGFAHAAEGSGKPNILR